MSRQPFNHLAVISVVIIHQIIGFIWYSPYLFGGRWLELVGTDLESLKAAGAAPYVVGIVASLLFCYVLYGLINKSQAQTATDGVKIGIMVWLGFILTTTAVNNLYRALSFELALIDAGYWLVLALLAGGVFAVYKRA